MDNKIVTVINDDDENKEICKYCYEETNDVSNPIIYPCDCNNGVHVNCLAIWLNYKKNNATIILDNCEICRATYIGFQINITPLSSPTSSDTSSVVTLEDGYIERRMHNTTRVYTIDLEFICCDCYLFEIIFYILGFIFSVLTVVFISYPSTYYNVAVKNTMQIIYLATCVFICSGLVITVLRVCKHKLTRNRRVQALQNY